MATGYEKYLEGMALLEAGRLEDALAAFTTSLELEEHFKTCDRIASLLRGLGRPDEAGRYVERAFSLNPQNSRVAVAYAELLDSSGQREGALRVLRDVLEREPTFAPAAVLRDRLASGTDQGRFRDGGESVYDFMGEMLVECPRCGACAVHRQSEASRERRGWFAPRRLVCVECGYTKDWAERTIARHTQRGVALDDYFGLPLWIREDCRHGVFWAYNAEHLRVLDQFVFADLRERVKDPKWGWSNRSLASRIPAWMKDRKNRDEVRKIIARLRERIPKRLR